ncbi:TPA: hypothetical protein ACN33E_002876 [Vibrio parahaemolyticus]
MKEILGSIFKLINHLIKIRFRAVITFTVIVGIVLGWIWCEALIENDLISKYQLLPDIVKSFVSVEDIWLGMLVNTSLPMFILFSIQFHTLKVKIPLEIRYYVFKALPYIKYVKWLSNKPIVFFVFTASILFGYVLYLGIIGSWTYLVGLIIPLLIYLLAIMLKLASDDILGGSKLSELTYQYNHWLGNFCLMISFLMWFYSSILKPYQDFSKIIEHLI